MSLITFTRRALTVDEARAGWTYAYTAHPAVCGRILATEPLSQGSPNVELIVQLCGARAVIVDTIS